MTIVGDIGDGKMGELSLDQAVEWVQSKDTRASTKILQGKFRSVVGAIMSTKDSGSTGGGNTRYTFDGAATYHESKGAGVHEGATVFFVKRPGGVAKVVAVGYHIGAQTYGLTWVHHDWTRLRNIHSISLDK